MVVNVAADLLLLQLVYEGILVGVNIMLPSSSTINILQINKKISHELKVMIGVGIINKKSMFASTWNAI